MIFPTMRGNTVNGAPRVLPRDFAGRLNVVLIAYTQDQQYDVDSWTSFLDRLRAEQPDLGIYEVPVVRRYPYLQRKLLDYWMYTGIPDPAVRDRTITLYTDVDAFNRALNLPGPQSIYVLLVDANGTVLWRTAGRFNASKAQALVHAIAMSRARNA